MLVPRLEAFTVDSPRQLPLFTPFPCGILLAGRCDGSQNRNLSRHQYSPGWAGARRSHTRTWPGGNSIEAPCHVAPPEAQPHPPGPLRPDGSPVGRLELCTLSGPGESLELCLRSAPLERNSLDQPANPPICCPPFFFTGRPDPDRWRPNPADAPWSPYARHP